MERGSLLGYKKEASLDWFVDGIYRKVGYGFQMSFWTDPWVGNSLLKDPFPRVFSITDFSRGSMGNMVIGLM